jgi:hypothetical protein
MNITRVLLTDIYIRVYSGMTTPDSTSHSVRAVAFDGDRLIAHAELAPLALALRASHGAHAGPPVLVFDAETSAPIDLDLRGSDADVLARLEHPAAPVRGPGRPRLGVVAREVTLLPRHWDWLQRQRGGASAALRRLIDTARQTDTPDPTRAAREATYRFMSAMAGDRVGFETTTRALFAGDRDGFAAGIAVWPEDIRDHLLRLAQSAF